MRLCVSAQTRWRGRLETVRLWRLVRAASAGGAWKEGSGDGDADRDVEFEPEEDPERAGLVEE